MNFEETFIERAVCEIRYLATLTYHEKRITLCKQILEKKPELLYWTMNVPSIELRDKDKEEDSNKILSISSKGSRLIFRNPGVYDNFIALADYLMTKTVQELEIDNLTRIGIRIFYFTGVKEGFEQLKNLLVTKLFNRKGIERFGGSIKDVASIIELEKDKYNFNVRIGPLSIEEIEGKVYKGEKYYVSKEKINPSLLVDVDYFRKNCPSREIRATLKNSRSNTREVSDKILSLLKEET